MSKPIIQIVYATNDKYAPYASVSIASLVENSSKDYYYKISIFHTGLEQNTLDLLNSMNGENYKVEALSVEHHIEKEMNLMYTNMYFSKEMFYRILIPHVFSDCGKAIYIDCDTVVLGDISELYNHDLENYTIGAVRDMIEPENCENSNYIKNELKIPVSRYINSGVLLINCERFRKLKMKERFFLELAQRKNLRYPDQDLINLVCAGEIKLIDEKWNYNWSVDSIINHHRVLNILQDSMEQHFEEDETNIGVLHFISAVKPWKNRIYPLAKHFWKYVPLSPFARLIEQSWSSIPRERKVSYKFLNFSTGGITLTVSLLDAVGVDGNINVCLDGNKLTVKKKYEQVIEIANKRYGNVYFEFFVPYDSLADTKAIKIYDQLSGKHLEASSSAPFPVNFETGAFYKDNRYIIYAAEASLVLAPFSEALFAQQKKLFRRKYVQSIVESYKDRVKLKANCLRFIHWCLKPFFKKEIWFISDAVDTACGNGQALFEYLVKNPLDHVKVYFVIDKNCGDYQTIRKIGKVISPYSKLFQIYMLFATRNIFTKYDDPVMRPIHCSHYLSDILLKCKAVVLWQRVTGKDLVSVYNRYENIAVIPTSSKTNAVDFQNIVAEILKL